MRETSPVYGLNGRQLGTAVLRQTLLLLTCTFSRRSDTSEAL